MIEFAVTFSPGADLDVNMGQVMEVLATEERTVELSMPSGNQVILPTSARGMRKVTVQKPDTMLPENIKKDVVIGGVTGALEAPPTGPYIEYTSLDSSGRVFTAKFGTNCSRVCIRLFGGIDISRYARQCNCNW